VFIVETLAQQNCDCAVIFLSAFFALAMAAMDAIKCADLTDWYT